MKEKYVIFKIFLVLIINFIKGNYIHLNFYKDKYISPYHIDNVFFSYMVVDIYFGTPKFKISLQISTDSPYFVVKGETSQNEYKQENSTSFYFIKYGQSYEYKNIYFHSIFFNENFQFNNQLIKLNSMMYWGKYPITPNYGLIGLQLKDIKFQENNIFINQIYEQGIIKDKTFSLVYENENKGELFIGDFPHNKTNLLKGKKFKICNNTFISNGIVYGIIFEEIIFREKHFIFKDINIRQFHSIAIFSNCYYGYIGSKEYNNFIYQTFFKPKIVNKSCWIQNIDNDRFYGYVCAKRIDISSISKVKFYHKELNYYFEIENEEMWVNYNNIKYFIIFFSYIDQHSWILGQKFLEKYTFVFNGEKNKLGLYYPDKKIKNTNIYKYLFLVLIIIVLVIFLYIYFSILHFNKSKKMEDSIELKDILDIKDYK